MKTARAGRAERAAHEHLLIESKCPECGAPVEAGLWDFSSYCAFCSSLLVLGGNLDNQVFAVADATDRDPLHVLVLAETSSYRGRLEARARSEEGGGLAVVPAWVDAKVSAFERELRASLELQHCIDFFVPYRITEKTVLQGVLGRRARGAKESFVQSFFTEEMDRLYDASAWNLRDRGLKIRGFRLRLLDDEHVTLCAGRFLPAAASAPAGAGAPVGAGGPRARFDRTRMRIRDDTQVIARIGSNWRERRLRVYKHLTYVCVSRAGREEHLLLDRQWGTVAARLEPREAGAYLRLASADLPAVLRHPEVRAIASECPNCGWELELPARELVSFCPTCRHALRVDDKGLKLLRYVAGETPVTTPGRTTVLFPFWSFAFRVRAGGSEFQRIWDWLAAVSPQQRLAERVRETDPERSRLFVPARDVHGSPPLDAAFESLCSYMNWRQPPTRRRRPGADEAVRMLGVEVSPHDARDLARFVLICLHDRSSTRRLNAATFRRMIGEAELELGEPELAMLPLEVDPDAWRPFGVAAVPLPILEGGTRVPRVTKSFNLV